MQPKRKPLQSISQMTQTTISQYFEYSTEDNSEQQSNNNVSQQSIEETQQLNNSSFQFGFDSSSDKQIESPQEEILIEESDENGDNGDNGNKQIESPKEEILIEDSDENGDNCDSGDNGNKQIESPKEQMVNSITLPQWIQCVQCEKWRFIDVDIFDIKCMISDIMDYYKYFQCSTIGIYANIDFDCDSEQKTPNRKTHNQWQITALKLSRELLHVKYQIYVMNKTQSNDERYKYYLNKLKEIKKNINETIEEYKQHLASPIEESKEIEASPVPQIASTTNESKESEFNASSGRHHQRRYVSGKFAEYVTFDPQTNEFLVNPTEEELQYLRENPIPPGPANVGRQKAKLEPRVPFPKHKKIKTRKEVLRSSIVEAHGPMTDEDEDDYPPVAKSPPPPSILLLIKKNPNKSPLPNIIYHNYNNNNQPQKPSTDIAFGNGKDITLYIWRQCILCGAYSWIYFEEHDLYDLYHYLIESPYYRYFKCTDDGDYQRGCLRLHLPTPRPFKSQDEFEKNGMELIQKFINYPFPTRNKPKEIMMIKEIKDELYRALEQYRQYTWTRNEMRDKNNKLRDYKINHNPYLDLLQNNDNTNSSQNNNNINQLQNNDNTNSLQNNNKIKQLKNNIINQLNATEQKEDEQDEEDEDMIDLEQSQLFQPLAKEVQINNSFVDVLTPLKSSTPPNQERYNRTLNPLPRIRFRFRPPLHHNTIVNYFTAPFRDHRNKHIVIRKNDELICDYISSFSNYAKKHKLFTSQEHYLFIEISYKLRLLKDVSIKLKHVNDVQGLIYKLFYGYGGDMFEADKMLRACKPYKHLLGAIIKAFYNNKHSRAQAYRTVLTMWSATRWCYNSSVCQTK